MATRLTPDRLAGALAQGKPAAAYYVAGSEGILKEEAVRTVIDGVLDLGTRDFNLDLLSAQNLGADQLAAACSTLPMMAERRVVIIRDVEAWKRKSKAKTAAVAYMASPATDTVLLMVQGDDKDPDPDFSKHATLVDCSPPVGTALTDWLDGRLATAAVTLTPEAREHLQRATRGDLGLLAAEVAKLGGLGGGEPLDRETVGALVGIRHGETIEDWRDAILRDDLPAAATMLPRVLEQTGISGVRLLFTLGAALIVLQWARHAAKSRRLRGRALASAVRQLCFDTRPMVGSYGPFAELVSEVVGQWPARRLGLAVRLTLAADVSLKSTTISTEEGILTDLMLSLAASRPRKAA